MLQVLMLQDNLGAIVDDLLLQFWDGACTKFNVDMDSQAHLFRINHVRHE
jgi:hypothetical protein